MVIRKPSDQVPRPSPEGIQALLRVFAPAGYEVPLWVEELIVVAYQNGRYDEACAETISAFD